MSSRGRAAADGDRAASFPDFHSSLHVGQQLPWKNLCPQVCPQSLLSIRQGSLPPLPSHRPWHGTQGLKRKSVPEGRGYGLNEGAGPGSQPGSAGSVPSWNPVCFEL